MILYGNLISNENEIIINNIKLEVNSFEIKIKCNVKNIVKGYEIFLENKKLNFKFKTDKEIIYFKECYVTETTNSLGFEHELIKKYHTIKAITFINSMDNISYIDVNLTNFAYNQNSSKPIQLKDCKIKFFKLEDYNQKIEMLENNKISCSNLSNLRIFDFRHKEPDFPVENFCNFLSFITYNKISYSEMNFYSKDGKLVKRMLFPHFTPYFIDKIDSNLEKKSYEKYLRNH